MASDAHRSATLTTLAPELIRRIIHFTEPTSHLDLACVCKALAHQCHYILQRHQNAHAKYAVTSDLHPATVPTLLRSALGFGDPFLAWHVRTFEVWGTRDSWKEWVPFTPEADTLIPAHGEPQPWTFTREEADAMAAQLNTLLGPGMARLAAEELEKGCDSAIKMLLLLLCPRLTNLKFVERPAIPRQDTVLTWLDRALEVLTPSVPSTPGLNSVQSLAVNVYMGLPFDYYEAIPTICPLSLFARLLLLPSLTSIYVTGLWDPSEGELDVSDILTAGSSSVEHIYLDSTQDVNSDAMECIAAAPRALVSLGIRGLPPAGEPWHDVDQLIRATAENQTTSLQSLMLYRVAGLHGYRNRIYFPDDINGLYRADGVLRQIGAHWEDVELYSDEDNPEKTFVETIKTMWPDTVETIVLFGDDPTETAVRLLEEGLIQLIREETLPGLKAVYLDGLEHDSSTPRAERVWFEKVVEVGREAGVDVHTVTNRHRMEHNVEFPIMMDKFDLETAPWYIRDRKSDDKWEADIYDGSWRPRGCQYCGKCANCFTMYTEDVWNEQVLKTQQTQPSP
ncbi:hypothetical protein ACHAQA_006278 [Verticillium albo-atrum]